MSLAIGDAAAHDEPVGLPALIRGAVVGMWTGGLPLVVLWLLLSAAMLGLRMAAQAAAPPQGGFALGQVILILAQTVLSAAGGAAALRLMLGDGVGGLRPDRGFLACAALLAGAGLLLSTPGWIDSLTPALGIATGERAIRIMTVLITGPLIGLVLVQFALWPVGLLRGRQDMTAGKARQRMRGVVLAYALACLAVALTYIGVVAGSTAVGLQQGVQVTGTQWFDMAQPWVGSAWSFYGLALAAAAYRLRVEPRERVAEVFD